MEQLPENNAGQDDNPAGNTAISLGLTLREARGRLGLSVADVAEQIKLAPRQIEALEADDFQHLPEMAYVRGFVRSYARILQLDAQMLMEALPKINADAAQLTPTSIGAPFHEAYSSQRQNKVWLGAALLLAVLVVIFAIWHFTTPLDQPKTEQVETPILLPAEVLPVSAVPEAEVIASSVPATVAAQASSETQQPPVPAAKLPAPQAAPKTQSAAPVTQSGISSQTTALRLVFDEESWVEIKDKDGNILASRINPKGGELRLSGNKPFSLVIGRAAGVRLYYQEKQVDLKPYTGMDVARLTLE